MLVRRGLGYRAVNKNEMDLTRLKELLLFCVFPYIDVNKNINYYMSLVHQLLRDMGVDEGDSFTVALGRGVYFQGVKRLIECSGDKFVLEVGKNTISVSGENLRVQKYFQRDLFLSGCVSGVEIVQKS